MRASSRRVGPQAILAGLRHVGLGRAVHAGQAVHQPAHAGGERLVGEVLVGEQRVAADRRHLAREQHGAHGRHLEVGRVGVPDAAEVGALVLQLHHLDDLGVVGNALDEGILHRLAHAAGEGQELGGGEVLAAKEDHQVVEQRAPDLGHAVLRQRPGQIDPMDLPAQRACDSSHLQHFSSGSRRPSCRYLRRAILPR